MTISRASRVLALTSVGVMLVSLDLSIENVAFGSLVATGRCTRQFPPADGHQFGGSHFWLSPFLDRDVRHHLVGRLGNAGPLPSSLDGPTLFSR